METHVDLGSGSDGGDPAATKPAMDEPHAAAAPSLPGTDALPAALPGAAAGARKRKAPVAATREGCQEVSQAEGL
ncbi:hypothetical protein D1007_04892 [Hordeum vulgare]|nr:hypothetical protein D1007_04892 [Hordeum vulgare]